MDNNSKLNRYGKEPTRMHINPHFKQSTSVTTAPHINPNFYQTLSAASAIQVQNIHFNPKFVNHNINNRGTYSANNVMQCTILTNNYSDNVPTNTTVPTVVTQQYTQSKYKLVNTKSLETVDKCTQSRASTSHSQMNYSSNATVATLKNIPTVKSKYKLVLNHSKPTAPVTSQKKTVKINKYKLVSLENIIPKIQIEHKGLTQISPRIPSKRILTVGNINRKIDRRNKLPTKSKVNRTLSLNTTMKHTSNVITIRGKKFTATGKSLRLIAPEFDPGLITSNKLLIRVNGKIYKQKSQSLFVRENVVNRRHLKKNNIPCPQYRKYGRCSKQENEKCPLLHDKKYVVVCPMFLKGQCQADDCLLSHQVSAEKMPTCSFYLQGCCVRESCPYLHVKLSDSTSVCEDFVKGYCERGDQCILRHVFICPQYAKDEKCSRVKCPYPHKKRVYKIEHTTNKKVVKAHKNFCKIQQNQTRDDQCSDPNRYYVSGETKDNQTEEIRTSRCQLGTLPSFIKL